MATFRCKMCGGELEIQPGSTVAECTYCGAKQTLPKLDDERRVNLYDRANHFRRNNDFDKAMGIYESILNEDKTEAEAYWGLILCKYGIEYVEDPATHRRVPTCHRASYDAVTADADYQNALQYADPTQHPIYEAEAAAIDEIQRGIIALAQKEDPYDVFICYKETDADGKRTQDSVIANDVYHQLTMEGFKVFYAAITLEDKLGTEYEPYIFSALNTAKVMLVLGSKVEYFNAVWVKNEWSRFLKIMQKDRSKLLIPCYKDIDPYDLPDEFAHLQAQDMSKIGFINDLVRGIKKVTQSEKATPAPSQTVVVQNEGGANVTSLLDRGNMALEDGEWDKANEFFEQVLNMDSRNGAAYLGQFLAAQKCKTTEDYAKRRINATSEAKSETLTACAEDESRISACIAKNKVDGYLSSDTIRVLFTHQRAYSSTEPSRQQQLADETNNLNNQKLLIRAIQFGAQAEVDAMKEKILSAMRERLSDSQKKATQNKENAIADYQRHMETAEKNVLQKHEEAIAREEADRAARYGQASKFKREAKTSVQMLDAAKHFDDLGEYRDSRAVAEECRQLAAQLEESEKCKTAATKKKHKTITIISLAIIAIFIAFCIILILVILPATKYNYAVKRYGKELADTVKDAAVGSTITFGAYEQDNDTSNGKETIDWIVLDKRGTSLLLISDQALDIQAYNTSDEVVYWENSTLRDWLNDEFINSAFNYKEQSMIAEVTISADKNTKSTPDNDTIDRIFLLSIEEAEKYFASDEARKCIPTDYIVEQGYSTKSGLASFPWWLRAPGEYTFGGAYVRSDGSVFTCVGRTVKETLYGVRPALWIDLGY